MKRCRGAVNRVSTKIIMIMNKEEFSVIYDGDCGFCQTTVNLLRKLDWLKKFRYFPFQGEGVFKTFPMLTKEMCQREMFLVMPNGKFYGGYDAFKIMTLYFPVTFLISWFFFLPGIIHIGRFVYRRIAENRHKIKIGNKVCKTDK
jgi:predicted DCC family thiol-disulfide oxidoreductase YuxK